MNDHAEAKLNQLDAAQVKFYMLYNIQMNS